MRELTLSEIKQIQIDILKKFTSFCKDNSLRYYLAYGTLIGSVRHQGYIPWDDDIDIIMPRPDYERFLQIFRDERYKIISPYNNKNCPIPYAKLYDDETSIIEHTDIKYNIGLNIDLFVLDGVPENRKDMKRHVRKCSFWLDVIDIKKISLNSRRSFFRNAVLALMKVIVMPLPFAKCMSRLVTLSQKYSFDDSSFCSDLSYTGALHLPKKTFGEGRDGVFEDGHYTLPTDYDTWLKGVYGDYMQLPPEEKRITHHDYKAYTKTEI